MHTNTLFYLLFVHIHHTDGRAGVEYILSFEHIIMFKSILSFHLSFLVFKHITTDSFVAFVTIKNIRFFFLLLLLLLSFIR